MYMTLSCHFACDPGIDQSGFRSKATCHMNLFENRREKKRTIMPKGGSRKILAPDSDLDSDLDETSGSRRALTAEELL